MCICGYNKRYTDYISYIYNVFNLGVAEDLITFYMQV